MTKISHEIPHLKRGILQSDNAGCYHKKELLLAIPILNNLSCSLKIVRIIHTETQDGKEAADAHGAVSNRHLVKVIETREDNLSKNATTPRMVAGALAHNGGLQNTSVQLTQINGARFTEIEELMKAASDQAGNYFSRANEYRFHSEVDALAPWAQLDLSNPDTWNQVSYDIHIIAYSNIGSGATFQVDFADRSFAPKVASLGLGGEEDDSAGDECDTSESESDDEDDDDDIFFQNRPNGDEFDDNEVEEDFVTSDFQYEGSTEKVFGEPPEALYNADTKFTKVAVLLHNNFGEILQRNSIAKKVLAAVDEGWE